jgi:hypothetical protein
MKRVLLSILFILGSQSSLSLELDPYQAWIVDIKDSSPVLNGFINTKLEKTIVKVNAKPDDKRALVQCSDIAIKFFTSLHASLITSKPFLKFIKKNKDLVDHSRGLKEGWLSSVWHSHYRYIPQLYFSSLSSALDIGGIRVGDDKIAHFFGLGRRYYKKYLKALKNGKSRQEAIEKAIRYGLRHENGILGKGIDGIFSHADLEANFQGFLLSVDLCEGSNPILENREGYWVQTTKIDFTDYVNPAMDEVYNSNHFAKPYWPLVRKRLKRYCWLLDDEMAQERWARYESIDVPSFSRKYIAEHFAKKGVDPQKRHSLAEVCGR